jgi:general secretion pathway protein A
MYKKFFNLKVSPFGVNPDPSFLWMTPQFNEVLACLEHGIRSRKGFVLLTGEVGTGKTTLLHALLGRLRRTNVRTAFVFNPRMDSLDFLDFMMTDFGIRVRSRTKSQMLVQFNQWLLSRYRLGLTVAVVIDEAQNLSTELLEEVRLLTNLETATEKLLQVVLSGQTELEDRIRQPEARQLRQRIALRCQTYPLTQCEVHEYITRRLAIAGTGEPIFSPAAMDAAYEYSQGVPRVINLLCEHALITAFVEELRPIPPAVIHEAAREFELDVLPPLRETSDSRPPALAPNLTLADLALVSRPHKGESR